MLQGQIQNVVKTIDGETLFKIDHLTIPTTGVVAVVGENGAGKTTLLNMLQGIDTDYTGRINLPGYVVTVAQINDIVGESGGEMTHRLIRQAISERPDILILDEPTSHLDVDHHKWLVNTIHRFKGLVIIVSHNRAFLREVATVVWSFENGTVTAFNGGYDDYLAATASKRSAQMQDYKQVTNEKKRLAQRAKTAGEKSARAKKINPHKHSHAEIEAMKSGLNGVEKGFSQQKKALNSRIERLGKVEKPVDATKLKLQNPLNVRPGKPVVTALNLTVSQADNLLIENVTFKIETGHRVAIVGPNGSGKSTLIQHLLSGAPGATHADNLRVSVANQDLSQLDTTKTALQNVMMTSTESEQVARDFLGAMGIRLMQVNEMVGQMSGGERVRVALVKALLQTSELLVLDEPTNYLDIPALEALTAYLQETQQAVLFVSHDEQLVADVATDVWQIVDKRLIGQYQ